VGKYRLVAAAVTTAMTAEAATETTTRQQLELEERKHRK
jgi:hypothetical protein